MARALMFPDVSRVRLPNPASMWVEFVVSSPLAPTGVSAGYAVFPRHKISTSKNPFENEINRNVVPFTAQQ